MKIPRLSLATFYLILSIVLIHTASNYAQTVDVIDSSESAITGKNDSYESEHFIPVANTPSSQAQTGNDEKDNISGEDEEGSGSSEEEILQPFLSATTDADEGSGDEEATGPSISKEDEVNDSSESTNVTVPIISESHEREGKSYEPTAETTSDEPQLIIFGHRYPNVTNEKSSDSTDAVRTDAEVIKPMDSNATHSEVARVGHPIKESQATYILLASLGVILVLLILYLVYKRYRSSSKHTHYINDAENAPQEMLNMNRNNIGKPIRTPTDEQCIHIPLIPDGDKEKANGLTSVQEPLLQQTPDAPTENGHCEPDADHDHTDSTPLSNGVHNDTPHDNNTATTLIPHKSPRYSPVSLNSFEYIQREKKNGSESKHLKAFIFRTSNILISLFHIFFAERQLSFEFV